jgi:hypothetical protein
MSLGRKLAGIAQELKQGPPMERLFRVVQKSTHALGLSPSVSVERAVVVEAAQPPRATRALSDLAIRHAGEADLTSVAGLDDRPLALLRSRIKGGDLIYLGELDGQVVCATCFHAGPRPFDEEQAIFARWSLEDASSYWSYDAMAPMEMRTLGVVAKLFEVALAEVFGRYGARRVRGFIHDWNRPSLLLHERMGFTVIGRVTGVGFPGVKWLRWESGGTARQWLLRRNSDFALPPVTS